MPPKVKSDSNVSKNKNLQFAKFLKKLRIDEDETLAEMADRLGMPAATLASIESGARSIPDGITEKIIQVYNIDDVRALELTVTEYMSSGKDIKIDLEDKKDDKDFMLAAIFMAKNLQKLNKEVVSVICGMARDNLRQQKEYQKQRFEYQKNTEEGQSQEVVASEDPAQSSSKVATPFFGIGSFNWGQNYGYGWAPNSFYADADAYQKMHYDTEYELPFGARKSSFPTNYGYTPVYYDDPDMFGARHPFHRRGNFGGINIYELLHSIGKQNSTDQDNMGQDVSKGDGTDDEDTDSGK